MCRSWVERLRIVGLQRSHPDQHSARIASGSVDSERDAAYDSTASRGSKRGEGLTLDEGSNDDYQRRKAPRILGFTERLSRTSNA